MCGSDLKLLVFCSMATTLGMITMLASYMATPDRILLIMAVEMVFFIKALLVAHRGELLCVHVVLRLFHWVILLYLRHAFSFVFGIHQKVTVFDSFTTIIMLQVVINIALPWDGKILLSSLSLLGNARHHHNCDYEVVFNISLYEQATNFNLITFKPWLLAFCNFSTC